jgi:phage-related protein
MGLNVNVNIKKKFKVNGQEYESIEDVPVEYREAFQKALVSAEDGGRPQPGAPRTKITMNGVEYENVEAMPPVVRMLYERALKTAETETRPRAAAPSPDQMLPGYTSPKRSVFLGAVIVLVLMVIILLLVRILH